LFIAAAENSVMVYSGDCVVDNPEWNSEEVERFQQAVVEYDKDFGKISQHVRINTVSSGTGSPR